MTSKEINELTKILDLTKIPKDIRISTITITCRLDTIFNTINIERYLDLDDDIVTVKSLRVNRTILVTKKRRKTKTRKTKKNAFYNQVSVGIKKQDNIVKKGIINIKLFINGAIQITGCKSIIDFKNSLTILFNKLKTVKGVYDSKTDTIIDKYFVNDLNLLELKHINKIKIAMINSNFNIGFSIDRENLYGLLLSNNITCSYDPVIHACVNIKYNYDDKKKISIFVFEKGTIIITGVNNCEQIIAAHKFINTYLNKNYNSISKRTIEMEDNNIDKIIEKFNKGFLIK